MKNLLALAANKILRTFDYEIKPRRKEAPLFTMDGVIERLRQRGISPGTIVDIGAGSGRWTRKALLHFPKVRYLLIEPLEERRTALQKLNYEHPNVEFVLAAAGDKPGEALLTVAPDLDGSSIHSGGAGKVVRMVPVITLDIEMQRRNLPAPYLVKFDTHGFELPILEGAAGFLKNACVLILEAYNFQLTERCLRFHEMCAHMESLGFRCADIADPMQRPSDHLLWQVDLVFLPANSPLFASRNYS